MSGIVFFKTTHLEKIRKFYLEDVACGMWMDQGDCIILQNGNLLLGFCSREKLEKEGLITFFYDSKEEVDRYYEKFQKTADAPPRDNPRYQIYHFFAKDPEGRNIEFQYFYNLLHHSG